MRYNIYILVAAALIAIACESDKTGADLKSDRNIIEVGANGGIEKIKISSSDEWVASVGLQQEGENAGEPNPWITVSPANGRGSVTCDFIIDSALTTKPRTAVVSILNVATNKTQRITVNQRGYDYSVEVDNPKVELKKFAEYGKRYFDVVVRSNFDFDVEIPDGEQYWLSCESYKLDLNRGTRPREVKVRFNWKVNNRDKARLADIKFVPKNDIEVVHSDILSVQQEAAEPIEKDTRAGDSLSLLNIANAMQCWTIWDSSTSMDTWNGITLWEERMKGSEGKVGRVKSVEIFLCNTYEGLPYEIQNLTAAEEIYIFSNENSMLKSINIGEYVCKLTNLKRLTVGAFGLTELHPDFVNLKNLEYLDLGSNNFQRVPEIITKGNFPNLRALVMNAQQRHAVSDLSNTVHDMGQIGGLIDEEKFPEHLLTWGLDTLVLSVNYLHGPLPTFEGRDDIPTWSEEEVIAADTLPKELIGTPKIMPTTKTFRINGNRLSGEAPKWLLMHPALDWWVPFSLVFPQEGRYIDGVKAGFTNAPSSLVEYYTKWYPNKKLANSIEEDVPVEDEGGIITK